MTQLNYFTKDLNRMLGKYKVRLLHIWLSISTCKIYIMNKYFSIFIFFSIISCYQQECNCNDFKTGNFKTEFEIKGVKKTVFFTRTKDLQIEFFNGKIDTSSVRWVNNCEFITRKIHPKTMQEEKSFSVKILSTTKNTYSFEFSEVGKSQKMNAIVTKINNKNQIYY